ncbi:MAG: delta-aminolevulinic acid dehydratase [Bacteroidales bacterium]|nr:delta-aminolevulinic acid dehydratase [Bacteroidales bacterium]
MTKKIEKAIIKLEKYCEKESFLGYDPFDGLNSSVFKHIPFLSKSRIMRLTWIQFFKRFPINVRKIAGIKKEYNPKALALFLSGYCRRYKQTGKKEHLEKIRFFSQKLMGLSSKNWSGACWGYNFDWQARAFFQPKYTPTVVATSFVVNALLDAFDILGDSTLIEYSRSACDFVLKDLNRTYDDKGNFAFSYSPLDKSVVFNASLLGSRLLARVYSHNREQFLIEEARKSVAFCCIFQEENGAWTYGILPYHQWIDNFHTGYNLECIADYMKYSGDYHFKQILDKGFDYYIRTFFSKEGVPKYYNNSIYPIDIHAPAQLVITVSNTGKFLEYKSLVNKVLSWTIKNMQSKKGYFFYQKKKYFTSRIPYMRWSQAWMFYALSEYVLQTQGKK